MQNKYSNDAATAPSAAPSASAAPAAPDGFKRLDDGPQMQSGEALLVEAYAFIWVVLFGLVLATWLRQRGLDARMSELEASIAKARAPRGPAPKPGAASPGDGAKADEGS